MTPINSDNYTLYLGDCLDILPTLALHVHAVITDPPYGINGSKGHINKKRGKGNYSGGFEDTPEYVRKFVVGAISYCIAKFPTVIVTPGNSNLSAYPQPDSFGCFYQPAAVGLQTFGNLDSQPIFYYGKNATGKNMGVPCSFKMTSKPDETAHPCRKPTREWERLILAHTLPGQTILDPFMGSGTTGEICLKNGRRFIGIELDGQYFEEARVRIANAAGEFILTPKERATGQMSLLELDTKGQLC